MSSIYHRTSIRNFEDRPVKKEDVLEILRAGMQAPSAVNQQPWEFYVITNPEKIRALSTVSPYSGCAAKAKVVIVPVYRKDIRVPEYVDIDMSIAQENMWLRTDELGLGGVWLGIAPLKDRMEKVRKILNLPDTLEAFSLFPVGYPVRVRAQENRYDEERIHFIS